MKTQFLPSNTAPNISPDVVTIIWEKGWTTPSYQDHNSAGFCDRPGIQLLPPGMVKVVDDLAGRKTWIMSAVALGSTADTIVEISTSPPSDRTRMRM